MNSDHPSYLTRLSGFTLSLLVGILLGALVLGAIWTVLGPLSFSAWAGLNPKTAWYLSRSSGTVAYLLLALSMVWGLLLSSKIIKESMPAVLSLAMHNILSWVAIATTGVHALSLLGDSYYTYTPAHLVIPFVGPYRPEWVGMGVIVLYLMLITSLTFSWRKQIGQEWWRRIHFLTFIAYVMATVHGVMAGTDSALPGMKGLYWGSGLLILFLTNYRILVNRKSSNGRSASIAVRS